MTKQERPPMALATKQKISDALKGKTRGGKQHVKGYKHTITKPKFERQTVKFDEISKLKKKD